MNVEESRNNNQIQVLKLRLGGYWRARIVQAGFYDMFFSAKDWCKCLLEPLSLTENCLDTLKSEGRSCVVAKDIEIAGRRLEVVIKRHWPNKSLRQFFRSFRPGKAVRGFQAAVKLQTLGISVARPLACLEKRYGPLTSQSILISEYYPNALNLYKFLQSSLNSSGNKFQLRKKMCIQLAGILGGLHKNNFWHRDAKASNFVVAGDGEVGYKVVLVDTDGVKPYFLRRDIRRYRALWQLAASLMSLESLNRTDYLRCFTDYCNLTGVDMSKRRKIFIMIMKKAEEKRRLSLAKAKR